MAKLSRLTQIQACRNKSQTLYAISHSTFEAVYHAPKVYYTHINFRGSDPESSSEKEAREALHIAGYFIAEYVDKQTGEYLRTWAGYTNTPFTAVDLINFGIGVARPKFPRGATFAELMNEDIITLQPKNLHIYEQIQIPVDKKTNEMETWESTNIILGDSYGDLLQIQDRRNDQRFLEDICEGLNLFANGNKGWSDEYINMFTQHISAQKIWDGPPENTEQLLGRVDYIIENSKLDTNVTKLTYNRSII